MDEDSRFDYWNQPSEQKETFGEKYDYNPEEEKGNKKEVDILEKDIEKELDSQMPTFMDDEVWLSLLPMSILS